MPTSLEDARALRSEFVQPLATVLKVLEEYNGDLYLARERLIRMALPLESRVAELEVLQKQFLQLADNVSRGLETIQGIVLQFHQRLQALEPPPPADPPVEAPAPVEPPAEQPVEGSDAQGT